MAIVSNLINILAKQAIGMGFDQFDNLIDSKIAEGREGEAFAALDQFEKDVLFLTDRQNEIVGGQAQALPGLAGITGNAINPLIDPNSSQGQAALKETRTLPPINPNISKATLPQQLAFQRGTQFIQNDPVRLANEAKRKQQEQEFKTRLGVIEDRGKKTLLDLNEVTPLARGQNLTRQEQLSRLADVETTKGEVRDRFAVGREQRAEERRRRREGEGGGGTTTVGSSQINSLQSQLKRRKDYVTTTANAVGDLVETLTPRGERVINIAADMISGTKKPNIRGILTKAIAQEKKEERERNKLVKQAQDLQTEENRATSRRRESPQVEPSRSKTREQVQSDIRRAQNANISSEDIRQAIIEEGFRPEEFGF